MDLDEINLIENIVEFVIQKNNFGVKSRKYILSKVYTTLIKMSIFKELVDISGKKVQIQCYIKFYINKNKIWHMKSSNHRNKYILIKCVIGFTIVFIIGLYYFYRRNIFIRRSILFLIFRKIFINQRLNKLCTCVYFNILT